jgi:6,7-dimethyl-8-ribityllumazine synthase
VATSQFSLPSPPYTLTSSGIKIGIAVAIWNSHITVPLLEAAKTFLIENNIKPEHIKIVEVPGSFELPLTAQMLFAKGYDAVICLGCVIKGDTPHFDYVCNAASEGILRVGLDNKKPCIFGVITTNTEQQAMDRAGGILGNKGSEAANTALWMLAAEQFII